MIRVLVVDDSFFMCKLLTDILVSGGVEVVGAAKSGREALKMIPRLKPEVITLDLVMPGWDGLTTLKQIMQECPTPVIILSAHSKEGADITLECLASGAISFIVKPSGELSLDIEKVGTRLLEAIKAAATVNPEKLRLLLVPEKHPPKYAAAAAEKIVVIGASTGGPQTLAAIVSLLPADFSTPLIVVQHLPSSEFTQSLAERFQRAANLPVQVAEDNETVTGRKIYLVPGGYSLTLQPARRGNRSRMAMRLTKDRPGILTPSIDTTMKSAAKIFKGKAIGVILTGMGRDGAEGMEAIKKAGGKTLVEDETALIFGMPQAVIERGCADSVLPAGQIAERIAALAAESDENIGGEGDRWQS